MQADIVPAASSGPGREPEWLAPAALAAVFAVAWVAVAPWSDAPAIDDWVYAWSVEHLLATGSLRVLEFSAVYPLAQTAWAAVFAGVFGFSFASLRLSTVVLAVLGCWAVSLTLREIGCRRSTCLLGGLALALHPVYFALTFTFMTEVPFVSLSALALYCYVRAVSRDEVTALWAGGACAILASAVRPIGILLPLTVLPALVWRADWRPAAHASAVALAAPVAVMVAMQVALPRVLGPLDWAAVRAGYLEWWFTVPMTDYAGWTVEALVHAAFPFAPLLLVFAASRRHAGVVVAAAGLLGAACWLTLGEFVTPLANDQTWSLREFTARSMIDGALPSPGWMQSAAPLLRTLGFLTLGALAAMWPRRRAGAAGLGLPESVVLTYGVLHVAAIQVFWLYNDRYYVVLAPALAIAAARALDARRRARWVAAALMAGLAGLDLTGTRDMLAFNRACDETVRALEASGIPAWDIDAGYALNGWRLYAHPEHLPPGADRRYDVPFVTSKATTRYAITNTPVAGEDVVRSVPLDEATWQATRAFYVVRRTPPAQGLR